MQCKQTAHTVHGAYALGVYSAKHSVSLDNIHIPIHLSNAFDAGVRSLDTVSKKSTFFKLGILITLCLFICNCVTLQFMVNTYG
jgi:hypothetical protein